MHQQTPYLTSSILKFKAHMHEDLIKKKKKILLSKMVITREEMKGSFMQRPIQLKKRKKEKENLQNF